MSGIDPIISSGLQPINKSKAIYGYILDPNGVPIPNDPAKRNLVQVLVESFQSNGQCIIVPSNTIVGLVQEEAKPDDKGCSVTTPINTGTRWKWDIEDDFSSFRVRITHGNFLGQCCNGGSGLQLAEVTPSEPGLLTRYLDLNWKPISAGDCNLSSYRVRVFDNGRLEYSARCFDAGVIWGDRFFVTTQIKRADNSVIFQFSWDEYVDAGDTDYPTGERTSDSLRVLFNEIARGSCSLACD